MGKDYAHPETGQTISFREPTTAKSIAFASFALKNREKAEEFGYVKKEILDPRWLQLGRIVRTSEGVWANLQSPTTDEKELNQLINSAQKVNGIYFLANGSAFAPYDSFEQGVQEHGDFVEGGLARSLEGTRERKAQKLEVIANPKLYKHGVNVWGFESVKKPVIAVASLVSYGGDGRLFVLGGNLYDNDFGYAFGVREDDAEGVARKK